MRKSLLAPVLLVILVAAGYAALNRGGEKPPADGAETEPPPQEEPPPEVPITLKGVSLSPRSYGEDDFTGFFEKALEAGDVVTWAGDWGFLVNGTAPVVVTELADVYGYEPVILVTHMDQSAGTSHPLTEETRDAYLDAVGDYSSEYRPTYMGVGIEVNVVYMQSPEAYAEFVEFFPQVYRAVKDASPSTKVFTVFQLEQMKGLGGGLFGGVNDESRSQWGLLDDFPDADLLAFTTYPCLVFTDPSEIPGDYYAEILAHTGKPVAFTEVGWFREGFPGWESDPEEQAEFIDVFFELTGDVEPVMVVWSFLYDQSVQQPFDTMGLLDVEETHTEAWDAWLGH
jgi:hypothetical protein